MDDIVALTKKLVHFRGTESRVENLRRCADFIADYFIDSGLTVERFEKDGYPSVVVTKHGTKKPKIFLNGHFDMVEGEDHQFDPKIEGDRMFGRGVFDMQSGNAVIMTLMKELAHTEHDVGLMLTGDEEAGGFRGVGYVMDFNYSSDVVIIPDGGMAVENIISREKGIIRFDLQAHGKRSHSAYPWLGDNAITKLMSGIEKTLALFPESEKDIEDNWTTNVAVTKINAGIGGNVVPEKAYAHFDVRYITEDNPEEILERIRKVLPDGVDLKLDFIEPATSTDTSSPYVEKFVETLKEHDKEPKFISAMAASDSRFFHERGIPFIISQPEGGGHHGPYEWVRVSAIGKYYDILKSYLDKVAR